MIETESYYSEQFEVANLFAIASYFDKVFLHPQNLSSDEQIEDEELTNPKQSTIHMDCLRSRAHLLNDTVKEEMEKVLTHYCRCNKLDYKQGLNEILAPFIYFRTAGVSLAKCYTLFSCFFNRYCLNFYHDKEFNSLEVFFKMVSIVLKYHDPGLARYLFLHDIQPQVFCISWLMTLFSNKLSLSLTYTLWQFLAAEQDNFFLFFIVVAIIVFRRENIMQCRTNSIYTTITDMIFKNEEQLYDVITIALLLRKTTPASLVLFFKKRQIFSTNRKEYASIKTLLQHIDELNLFLVLSTEISLKQHFKHGICEGNHCYFCALKKPLPVQECLKDMKNHFALLVSMIDLSCDIRTMEYSIEFVIFDLRTESTPEDLQLIEKVFKKVHKINITQRIESTETEIVEKYIQAKGNEHFIFFLIRFSFEDIEDADKEELYVAKKLIALLNSYSFPYLSILEGGQDSFHNFTTEIKIRNSMMMSRLKTSQCLPEYQTKRSFCQQILKDAYKLKISEVILISTLFYSRRLLPFIGQESSSHEVIMISDGFIAVVESNPSLRRFINILRSGTSIVGKIISEPKLANIEIKIHQLIPILSVSKVAVKIYKQNVLSLKVNEQDSQQKRWYYGLTFEEVLSIDRKKIVCSEMGLQGKEGISTRRFQFETVDLEHVKEIGKTIKGNFDALVMCKRAMSADSTKVVDADISEPVLVSQQSAL